MHIFQLKSNDMFYKIEPAWILLLEHIPPSGEHTFYKVKDANHIVLIDSFGNEPQKEDKKNYIHEQKV